MKNNKRKLSAGDQKEFLAILKTRFEKNKNRHKQIEWAKVQSKLESNPEKLWTLNEMEQSGGEPDVVGTDKKSGEIIFYDCAAESPKGRRSICYDHQALEARKENKPGNSAVQMAEDMGCDIL